ncbi:hypothetical protein IT413_06780 [Candidatus Peregrinibacteria bacterium]|nr:hypothetical protein [Candidatus Peregrinibacteria bacterium]
MQDWLEQVEIYLNTTKTAQKVLETVFRKANILKLAKLFTRFVTVLPRIY